MKSHKEIAIDFLQLVTTGKIREAYERHVSSALKHHNPYFKGDAESLQKGMEENDKMFPNKVYEVKGVLEDGDLVAVHGFVKLSEDKKIAVVHIFRFENDKIVELWDVGQEIPKDSPNENGMF